jgi:hypothetical protein
MEWLVDDLRRVAYQIVLRACGFASLAVCCVMIGLSFDARAAFKAGGVLTLLIVAVLMIKAYEARTKDYHRTEMWLYLPEDRRPSKAAAQSAISTVMRETYLLFARWTAIIAIVMWTIALLLALAGY